MPITFQSLKEGDNFDKDIKKIMTIITDVEREFSESNMNRKFQQAYNRAYDQRVL